MSHTPLKYSLPREHGAPGLTLGGALVREAIADATGALGVALAVRADAGSHGAQMREGVADATGALDVAVASNAIGLSMSHWCEKLLQIPVTHCESAVHT